MAHRTFCTFASCGAVKCQGASGKYGILVITLFLSFLRLQQPHVLMSNPCGAVRKITAPYYFAINPKNRGDSFEQSGNHRVRNRSPAGRTDFPADSAFLRHDHPRGADPALPHYAGYPVRQRCRAMRCGCWPRKNLCLSGISNPLDAAACLATAPTSDCFYRKYCFTRCDSQ